MYSINFINSTIVRMECTTILTFCLLLIGLFILFKCISVIFKKPFVRLSRSWRVGSGYMSQCGAPSKILFVAGLFNGNSNVRNLQYFKAYYKKIIIHNCKDLTNQIIKFFRFTHLILGLSITCYIRSWRNINM